MKTIALLRAATTLAGAQIKAETFDRTKLVIAFYRSTVWKQTIQAKQAERGRALQAGDRGTAAPIERWGKEQQEPAHRELAGKAPLNNVLAVLQPRLQDLAHSAGVAEIRDKSESGEQAVDLSGRIPEMLK